MTTLEILRRGRERVAKGWCQKAQARDADGFSSNADSPSAAQWCAIGAIVDEADESGARLEAQRALRGALGRSRLTYYAVVEWNDTPGRTQAEVITLFEKAIAAEEAAAP